MKKGIRDRDRERGEEEIRGHCRTAKVPDHAHYELILTCQ